MYGLATTRTPQGIADGCVASVLGTACTERVYSPSAVAVGEFTQWPWPPTRSVDPSTQFGPRELPKMDTVRLKFRAPLCTLRDPLGGV